MSTMESPRWQGIEKKLSDLEEGVWTFASIRTQEKPVDIETWVFGLKSEGGRSPYFLNLI